MATEKTVFISYSSKDGQFVQNLATCLKELNITYFKAPETIPVGSNYAREIPRAIKECGVFLLVLSKNSQDSIWVEKDERRVNAKSLLGVLSLGIMGNTQIRIIAGGPDEEQAVDELVKLVESGFAE